MTTSAPNNSTTNTTNSNSNSNSGSNNKTNTNNLSTAVISPTNNSNNPSVIGPLNTTPTVTTTIATITTTATTATTVASTVVLTPVTATAGVTAGITAGVTATITTTTTPPIVPILNSNIITASTTSLTTPLAILATNPLSTIAAPIISLTPSLAPSIMLPTTPTSHHSNSNNRAMQSDEDFNIRFVNLVRQHRCLYDKKVPEYRNRDNQEKAWALISQETRENVIHCKERWRNLRACLSRYIKQQSGSDPQHKPYYLTEHMAFLLPFLKSTRNSLDGNNSLAQLYQYSQQQYQYQAQQHQPNTTTNPLQVLPHFGTGHNPNGSFSEQNGIMAMGHDMKHSISENDDEETIDAFDPAFTNNLQQQLQRNGTNSPALSDTASANTLQNFIPDVQLSELQTSDGTPDLSYLAQQQHPPAHQHNVGILRRGSNDYHHQQHHHSQHHLNHQPIKRIKTECHASEAATTASSLALYGGENSDMEFFRSILPDIALLTPQQKRKLKIGILELIDDVIERYPADRTATTNHLNNNNNNNHIISNNNINHNYANNNGTKQRRNSNRDWRR